MANSTLPINKVHFNPMDNPDTFSINQMLDSFKEASTQLILDMDRGAAVAFGEKVRTIYGSADPFLRTFVGDLTILLITRRLPGLITLLRNDPTLNVRHNEQGHLVVSYK